MHADLKLGAREAHVGGTSSKRDSIRVRGGGGDGFLCCVLSLLPLPFPLLEQRQPSAFGGPVQKTGIVSMCFCACVCEYLRFCSQAACGLDFSAQLFNIRFFEERREFEKVDSTYCLIELTTFEGKCKRFQPCN